MAEAAANLARNVKHLRDLRGLTQAQASALAEIPRATWAHGETGEANPTLAVRVGDRATRLQYATCTALAYVTTAVLALGEDGRRWILLPWLTLPLGIALTRRVTGGLSGRDLNPMLERTGKLLLIFGVLLAVGLVLTGRAQAALPPAGG